MMCRSVRQTPAPPIFTMTSSGPLILGSGTSSITGWVWNSCNRTAFMGPPRPAVRFCDGSSFARVVGRRRFSLPLSVVVPVPQHAAAYAGVRLDADPGELGLAQVQRRRLSRHALPGNRVEEQGRVVLD